MSIIDTYGQNKSAQTIVDLIKQFHEKMILILCLSNDTEKIPTSIEYYSENNIYNYLSIYDKICKADFASISQSRKAMKSFYEIPTKKAIENKIIQLNSSF